MDYDSAVKELKDIREAMGRGETIGSRDPGWFFLVHGAMWLLGFLVTQFAPSLAAPAWISLSAAGTLAMVLIGRRLFGGRGRLRLPGLGRGILGVSLGVVVFDLLLVLTLGLRDPRDFTMLAALSTAFCLFVIGIITRRATAALGAFMGLSIAAAGLLAPAWIYLSIALLGGGSLMATGAFMLLRGRRADA